MSFGRVFKCTCLCVSIVDIDKLNCNLMKISCLGIGANYEINCFIMAFLMGSHYAVNSLVMVGFVFFFFFNSVFMQLNTDWSKYDDRLMKAAERGDAEKISSILAKKGVNPTKLDVEGRSA